MPIPTPPPLQNPVKVTFRKLPEESPIWKLQIKKQPIDLALRKLKHRVADMVNNETLDALGVHRATLEESDGMCVASSVATVDVRFSHC